MMKKITLLFCISFSFTLLYSQTKGTTKKKSSGINLSVSPSVNIPIGDFSSTHWGGMGVTVAPGFSKHNLNKTHTISFTYQGGIAYYFGKEETVSGYVYKYPGFTYVHAFAGLSFIVPKSTEVLVAAGPAISIYNGNTQFNAGASLTTNFYISKDFSLGPSITMMKEFGTNALWAASIKATFYFIKDTGGGIRF